jgi:hypothetical protein
MKFWLCFFLLFMTLIHFIVLEVYAWLLVNIAEFNSSLLKLILSKALFVLFWFVFVSSVYFSTIAVGSKGKIIKIDIDVSYICIGYLLICWYIPFFIFLRRHYSRLRSLGYYQS